MAIKKHNGKDWIVVEDTSLATPIKKGYMSADDKLKLDGIDITKLLDKVKSIVNNHEHNYAGSESAGGAANSALKLNVPVKIGNANFDGSINITLDDIGAAAKDHEHHTYSLKDHTHNYAGSDTAGGAANAAKKLQNARNIIIDGAIKGEGLFDGSSSVKILTTVNHEHKYAGSESAGGAATSALKLDKSVNIKLSGAVEGSGTFDGSGDLEIKLEVNHSHDYAAPKHTHNPADMTSGTFGQTAIFAAKGTDYDVCRIRNIMFSETMPNVNSMHNGELCFIYEFIDEEETTGEA